MKYVLLSCAVLALTACSHSDNSDDMSEGGGTDGMTTEQARYNITLTNLTAGQPFSPPVAMLNSAGFSAWQIGTPATVALEQLAEGGATSDLVALMANEPHHAESAAIGPGASASFEIAATDTAQMQLTLATMLVNTNDAFTGVTAYALADLAQGDTMTVMSHAYDAGTENNTESSGTMPGPADGGEGFNASRDDVTSTVTYHGGVVSQDDGYAASVLSNAHRFDNPVMKIEIERL